MIRPGGSSLTDLPAWARQALGKRTMPLPLESLRAAVRITSHGDLRGTGFFVRVRSEAGHGPYSYLITAHHVIKNQSGIEVEIPNPSTNGELWPPVAVGYWRQPLTDVDLAIAPYQEGEHRNHHTVWSDLIWSGHADLGGLTYYVGIFEPLGRPIARSGTIAALEQEGIPHKDGYMFPAHLVDCRSYGGFSGSPCSMEIAFARLSGKDVPEWVPSEVRPVAGMTYYTFLCGMFTSHYDSPKPEKGAASRFGLGVILPSRLILQAVMAEDARDERKGWDKDRAATKADEQPSSQNAGRSAKNTDEFFRLRI